VIRGEQTDTRGAFFNGSYRGATVCSEMMNIKAYRSVSPAIKAFANGAPTTLFFGNCLDLIRCIPNNSIDLTITSPPYCMGKEYETSNSVEDFIAAHKVILPEIVRITREGGSICWQVGYHVANQALFPLDYAVFQILSPYRQITLRNRIVWSFGHGLHASSRFSGRHETILWFTKGADYYFDLDSVRVPQKYPGKRHYKGPRKGQLSGNPKGKNPGNVWEIPNVKRNHVEKLSHPCQFPVGLADRLVRALSPKSGIVFDPFMGSASAGVGAIINDRRFMGAEIDKDYGALAHARLSKAYAGTAPFRPAEQPIFVPGQGEMAARRREPSAETIR
jgi:adenine-specific DNA-methyltransferase